MNITAVICKKCKDMVYSRARHDYRSCSCGAVAIDGGRDYVKLVGEEKDIAQVNTFDLKVSEKELYDDWNLGKDKYGLEKGVSTLEDIIFGKKVKDSEV